MSLKINRIGFFSLAMAALTMVACSDSREQTENTATETQQTTDSNTAIAPAAETTYPSFTLQDVNGNAVNLQNMKGKKSVYEPVGYLVPAVQKRNAIDSEVVSECGHF